MPIIYISIGKKILPLTYDKVKTTGEILKEFVSNSYTLFPNLNRLLIRRIFRIPWDRTGFIINI